MECALDYIASCLRKRLEKELESVIIERLVREITSDVTDHMGGSEVYVRKRPRSAFAERNAEIRAEFNGRNTQDLMFRHKISRSRIYQIIKQKV